MNSFVISHQLFSIFFLKSIRVLTLISAIRKWIKKCVKADGLISNLGTHFFMLSWMVTFKINTWTDWREKREKNKGPSRLKFGTEPSPLRIFWRSSKCWPSKLLLEPMTKRKFLKKQILMTLMKLSSILLLLCNASLFSVWKHGFHF